MKYTNEIIEGRFISRPNRFIAKVEIGGSEETVHVKNTGRCRELLLPGVKIYLEKAGNLERKTKYDLIAVEKEGLGIVNIDSQAPNKAVHEWLLKKDYTLVKPEYKYGNSRIDFYMERGDEKYLLEVKGCTLEIDGKGYFPDAPTTRGAKHLHELIRASEEGIHAVAAFVIPMEGVTEVVPYRENDPEFADAYELAVKSGVEIWNLPCRVDRDGFEIIV
ncbi:MAG: DNA/RNA nuclease SfsA [Lachnospiraceae bacterium]|nr:DNA/RNA nuclease SfsA [Lachnospiraceae bacterium]